MEVKTCSRCKRLKDVNMFGGFKQCNTCRENCMASHHRNFEKKTKIKLMRRQERTEQTIANIAKLRSKCSS